MLITIGSVTGVSIAALFTGGLMPGAGAGAGPVPRWRWSRAAATIAGMRARAGATRIARSFVVALPALVLPFVIRSAVVEGVATATEVSTIGIVYCALAGLLIYRQFDWRAAAADAGANRGRCPARSC